MKILFDHGTPAPLRHAFDVRTWSLPPTRWGWTKLDNGALLNAAETEFDVLITTDQNLQYQQNLPQRTLAILVLSTTSWPRIQSQAAIVAAAVDRLRPGDFVELTID